MPVERLLVRIASKPGLAAFAVTLVGPDASETQGEFEPSELTGTAGSHAEMARALEKPEDLPAAFAKLETHLGALLFRPEIEPSYKKLREGRRLEIEVAEELADLPWELAMLPDGSFPFADPARPAARYYAGTTRSEWNDPHAWPLRILVVVGAKPDDPKVNAAEETRHIRKRLVAYGHSIDLELQPQPTKDDLLTMLRDYRPHVIHFIGHCEEIGGLNGLRFQRAAGPWDWFPQGIQLLFQSLPGYLPRLVFLNACRTHAQRANLGIARSFLQIGVPAVVSMQANIQGDVAAKFASVFYESLATGLSVDGAVAKARTEIDDGGASVHWAIPVLTLSHSPDDIVPKRPAPEHKDDKIWSCPAFKDIRLFANRRSERRRVLWSVHPPTPGTPPSPIVVIHGAENVGKSHLVKWCLEGCALRGHRVHYLPLTRQKVPCDPVTFLHLIQTEALTNELRALREEYFYRFNFEKKNLLATGVPGSWKGKPAPVCTDPFDPQKLKSNTVLPQLFESFHRAIRDRAALLKSEQKLLIVLDFDEDTPLDPAMLGPNQPVRELFLERMAQPAKGNDHVPGVHLILVLRTPQDGYDPSLKLEELAPPENWVDVDLLDPKKYEEVVLEFIRYDLANFAFLADMAKKRTETYDKRWGPAELQGVATLMEGTGVKPFPRIQ